MKRRQLRLFTSLIVVLSLLFVNVVSAGPGQSNSKKPPKAQNAKVTIEDLQSYSEYAVSHKEEIYIVEDKKESNGIKATASKNKELQQFTGLNNKELETYFKSTAYSGKSQNKYKVYSIKYQFKDRDNNELSVLATYDVDRDILIEALTVIKSYNDEITIVSRNTGITFEGSLNEVERIQNANSYEKQGLLDKNIKKYMKKEKNKNSNQKNLENVIGSVLSVETASANTCSGVLELNSTQCSWATLPYCVAAGLLGLLPGVICTIGYTYVCNHLC